MTQTPVIHEHHEFKLYVPSHISIADLKATLDEVAGRMTIPGNFELTKVEFDADGDVAFTFCKPSLRREAP